MKPIFKFIIGGILFIFILRIPYFYKEVISIGPIIGSIVLGIFLGLVAYNIFGKNKPKLSKRKNE